MSSRENKLEKTIINAEIAYKGVVVDVYQLYSSVKCGRHVSGSYRTETEEMTARPGDVIIKMEARWMVCAVTHGRFTRET